MKGARMDIATDRELIGEELQRLTWMNSTEAAKYLRKSRNALLIMVNRGYVRPRKFRGRLYFLRIDLDRLLESSPY
ncbi:MAG: helix-turn-helix domain-containing protein [Bdellovibrionales bacterium]|nr:helix-turn-helix domain-containing protein [Bdellovibrionales bacterium]